jgi:hypothetical protein
VNVPLLSLVVLLMASIYLLWGAVNRTEGGVDLQVLLGASLLTTSVFGGVFIIKRHIAIKKVERHARGMRDSSSELE